MTLRRTSRNNINFWAMMNNVIIASLVKGQMIPVLLFFLLLFMIFKMKPDDVARLMFAILADLETGAFLGYVFCQSWLQPGSSIQGPNDGFMKQS